MICVDYNSAQIVNYSQILNIDTAFIEFSHEKDFEKAAYVKDLEYNVKVGDNYIWLLPYSYNQRIENASQYFYHPSERKLYKPFVENLPKKYTTFFNRALDMQLITNPSDSRKIWYSNWRYIVTDSNDKYKYSYLSEQWSPKFRLSASSATHTTGKLKIGDSLYIRFHVNTNDLTNSKGKVKSVKVPFDVTFGVVRIDELSKTRRIKPKMFNYITLPDCGMYRKGLSTGQRSFSLDSISNNLVYLDGIGDKIVLYNLDTRKSICYSLPDYLVATAKEWNRDVDTLSNHTFEYCKLKNIKSDSLISGKVFDFGLFSTGKVNQLLWTFGISLNSDKNNPLDSALFERLNAASYISGNAFTHFNGIVFCVYQWLDLTGSNAIISKEIIVPIEHGIKPIRATPHSITGFKGIQKGNMTVPAEVTWHLK